MDRCEACGGSCRRTLTDWHYECLSCGTEHSTLRPRINTLTATILPDEAARVRGLVATRKEGYRRLLSELDDLGLRPGGRLLEVGSSYGWFLAQASDRFAGVVGIEPDDRVRTKPEDPTIEVRAGYFPGAVGSKETFDVVVFNDVFEHIPDTCATAAAVASALRAGGIAVVSLPVTHGTIYRVTKMLCRFGVRGPFERMWQAHFPSPHLYYFSRSGLQTLFENAGLRCERVVAMPTLQYMGLWARIRHAEPRLLTALTAYASSLVIAAIVPILAPDVECFLFRRAESSRV